MEHHGFNWIGLLTGPEYQTIGSALVVALILVGFAAIVRGRLANVEAAIPPEDGFTARNVAEAFVDAISGLAESAIGHHSEKYVPLLASFFAFILIGNLIGLVPGFSAPTSDFNVTFALGVVSFIAYNAYGMRAHGAGKHLKHLLGPVVYIAPLMLIIELFSHGFRPVSLGIRLFANMHADHAVLTQFLELTKLIIPVAFYLLGAFVCLVQAFVFTMLSAIYISLAVSHDH